MKAKSRFLILLLSVVIVTSLTACSNATTNDNSSGQADSVNTEPGTYYAETAEDAVNYFVESFLSGDYAKALSICAVDEVAENMNGEELLNAAGIFATGFIQPDFPIYKDARRADLLQTYYTELRRLSYAFALSDNKTACMAICSNEPIPVSGIDVEQFFSNCNPSYLSNVSVDAISESSTVSEESKEYMVDNMTKQLGATISGYEDWIVHYSCNDLNFASGMSVVEFPDGWQIYGINSTPCAGVGLEIIE